MMARGHAAVTEVTHPLGGDHAEVTLRTHAGVTLLTFPLRSGSPPYGGSPDAGGDHA